MFREQVVLEIRAFVHHGGQKSKEPEQTRRIEKKKEIGGKEGKG